MPYVKIQSNISIDEQQARDLLTSISQLTARELGKPESYVMVALEPLTTMMFAGSDEPLAYLELKSIGLPDSKTAQLSEVLCDVMQESLGISKDRVYIEFADAPRNMWGWNGGTF
ncbi:MAG: phenylpyruvate tautomerase MIF-related protein [Gammaproteobacteria bacterium]|nr:MAG: phenylpyruvate tautomerase MIF-related protein [Gammaproteobacteria bacterium]